MVNLLIIVVVFRRLTITSSSLLFRVLILLFGISKARNSAFPCGNCLEERSEIDSKFMAGSEAIHLKQLSKVLGTARLKASPRSR